MDAGLDRSAEILGRESERAVLRDALAAALRGEGVGLVLLIGEAGIGKTTLAQDLATRAATDGVTPAWGRCWDTGGAPAFWPWQQVLRRVAEDVDLATIQEGEAQWIAHVAPDVAARSGLPARTLPADHEQARFAVLRALTAVLRVAARRAPLLVVLDDIHAADVESLRALDLAAAGLSDEPVLFAATVQEAPLRARGEAEAVAASLLRRGRRIDVGGLPREATAGLLARHAGRPVPAAVVRAVQARTDGNPFFVDELGGALGVDIVDPAAVARQAAPDGVSGAARTRLASLSAPATQLLTLASVIGRRFRVVTLERVADLDRATVLDLLDEAQALGVVQPERGGGAHRFTHGLLREGLYGALRGAERARRHLEVAEVLEQIHAADGADARLPELAHHFVRAAPLGEIERAVTYSERAADSALAACAHEQAAEHLSAAISVLELGATDVRREARLRIALGEAQQTAALPEGRISLLEAARGARDADDAQLLARAALAFGPYGLSPGVVDEDWVGLLLDALSAQPAQEWTTRARLLARLTRATYFSRTEHGRRPDAAREAITLARAAGDDAVLAAVLADGHVGLWGPDTVGECLELTLELEALCADAPQRADVIPPLLRRADLALDLGDVRGSWEIDAHAERLARVTGDVRGQAIVRLHHARRALLEGRFDACPPLHGEALSLVVSLKDSPVPAIVGAQALLLALRRGTATGLEAAVRGAIDVMPDMPIWRAALAHLLLGADRPSEARAEAERLAAGDFADVPRNDAWLATVVLTAVVLARTGAATPAVRALLEPYAGRMPVAVGGAYFGLVSHALGVLAAAAGDQDAARAHLASARAQAVAAGALPDRVAIDADEALLGGAEDSELGARARAEARALGLTPVLTLLDAGASAPVSAVAVPTGTLRREGDVWTLELDGRLVRLRHGKGVGYLAVLLERPGVEIAALDLEVGPGTRGAGNGDGLAVGAGDADLGETLDPQARNAFRERAGDLRAELEEAERFNDPERAAAARSELDALVSALGAATGLGGRARRPGSATERSRVNVTRAIKAVLRRVGEHDEHLGAELTATVRTGTFCVFAPDPRRPVRWAVDAGG